jgi:hypothetical protein
MVKKSVLMLASLVWLCAALCAQVEYKVTSNGVYRGEAVSVGNGIAYSWIKLGADKQPEAIGVALTETALEGLKSEPPSTSPDVPNWQYTLRLPQGLTVPPYDHITLDWNPKGHNPTGVYGIPHFDLHFFTISQAMRAKITARGDDLRKCDAKPDAEYIPESYFFIPASEVPEMGSHWADSTCPELNGKPFVTSLLYGFYDAKVVFYDPMVSLAFLKSQPNLTASIKQPQAYGQQGFHPTNYSVKYDPTRKEYNIYLHGFRRKE